MLDKFIIKLLLVFVLMGIAVPPQSFAQAPEEVVQIGPRKQLATIIFSGLGGAILGLSTLSFYGRPQEKLQNIAFGFALGIIGGTIYTTYKTATRPYDSYQPGADIKSPVDEIENLKAFQSKERLQFPMLSYHWQF